MLLQVPSDPGRLAAWQRPVHAVFEHLPSVQNPLVHWLSDAHALPCGCSAAAQKPFTHVAPAPGHTWLHAPQLLTSFWTSTH